ncbi:Sporulation kinase E [Phycisphaerae bacterium RAS1]|nr:Sporulation kinase E [Phycisphaerae bacterium RAS1]
MEWSVQLSKVQDGKPIEPPNLTAGTGVAPAPGSAGVPPAAPRNGRRARPSDGLPRPSGPDQLSDMLREYTEVTARLQQTHETLAREVDRLRGELASKDRELERRRRLAALGELAAGMAHEVRNPLGAISLYSGLLRGKCGDPEAALKLIEKIEAGIRAIDGVVEETLALAPRSGQLVPLPLQQVLERAADFAAAKLSSAGVSLDVDLRGAAVEVMGEEAGLQRVIANLLVNAAEASPRGARVQLAALPTRDGRIAVRVSDEGCGLPDELIHRIFDPFFTTKPEGTGLGLAIAHRLVEAYGGRITAANRPQGGAEFVVTLIDAAATGRPSQPAHEKDAATAA